MTYNLPPGVTDADIDRVAGGSTPAEQQWIDRVIDTQNTVKELFTASVDILIKNRKLVSLDDLHGIFQGHAEGLWDTVAPERGLLEEAGYDIGEYTSYPDNYEAFVAREFERLVDALRVKPVDAAGLLYQSLRPINPATLLATGALGHD